MDGELRSMVMAYRVTELQALLGFAGKNKTGRKNELQARALELVKVKSPPIVMKIRELYRSIQISNYSQPLNTSVSAATASSLLAAKGGSSSSYGSGSYSSDTKLTPEPSNPFGRSVGYHRVMSGDGQYRTVPICPDIKMKELPFYDILAVLLRPTSLLNQGQSPKQETQHSFCLSPSQAGEITNSREVVQTEYAVSKIQYQVQVQLRFCALDSTEEQDDLFPQGLIVKVNGRVVQLPAPIPSNRPGVEPKRPSKPLNITTNVKCCPLSTNTIHVSWIADPQRSYCMLINIVKKLTADQLFGRLKNKRIQPADFTRGRIKEITTAEEEDLCAPTSIRVSVACPLGKSRMSYPCRATSCKHLQCFDANSFLLMNERKPTFVCPVCNKHLKFGDLCIDGYFMDVIKNLSIEAGNEIELYADGSWLPAIKVKSETEDVGPPSKRLKSEPAKASSEDKGLNQTIDLDDDIAILEDDDDMKPVASSSSGSKSCPAAEPEVIDLIDSSDDEDNTTMQSTGSGHGQASTPMQPEEETETVQSVVSQPEVHQSTGEDDEEEIGIRPRRRKAKISYVEESSSDSSTTNEGDAAPAPSKARRPRSPACIELSDSGSPTPSPESFNANPRRPFASVGTGSSQGAQASSSANNNRSGSGSSSTIYSSSGMGTATVPTATTTQTAVVAAGGTTGSSNSSHHLHPYHYQPPYYSASSTFSISSSLSASSSSPSGVHHHQGASSATTSSSFFPPNISVPGYSAFDGAARVLHPSTMSTTTTVSSIPSWEDDLNAFINPQALNYGGGTLTGTSMFDDFLNVATAAAVSGHHPFSTSSTSSSVSGLYNPHSGGGTGGGGSRGGAGMSGYAGGWM